MTKEDLIEAAIAAGYKHVKPMNGPEQLIRRNHNGAAVGVRFDGEKAFNRRHQAKHAAPFDDLDAVATFLEVEVAERPDPPAGTFSTKKVAVDARPEGMTIAQAEALLVKDESPDDGDEPWSYTKPE